jgi:hypothetical protein
VFIRGIHDLDKNNATLNLCVQESNALDDQSYWRST